MSRKSYDLLVVGAGVAGQAVATAAAGAGKSVAMTEGRAYGGTCPLRGCDPKLVLHAVAKVAHDAHRLRGKGITGLPTTSWSDLMAWKRGFTEPVPPASREKMREQGIEVYEGYARFEDASTLRFGEDGPLVTAGTIVLATGLKPRPLDLPGAEHLLTSDDFLDMDDLPARMIIVGGGYIGMESACVAQALGCEVTVVVSGPVPLEGFDPQLADLLRRSAEEDLGMRFVLDHRATAVRKNGEELIVTVEDEEGRESELTTDRVIHCAGRVPNIAELELERAGIEYDESAGIRVNAGLRTTNERVYALGDCADSGLPLTPVASYAAQLLNNILRGDRERVTYPVVPTVAFCLPPIAAVGLSEADMDGRRHEAHFEEVTDWFTARHRNAPLYAYKTIVEKASGRIRGAHLVGPAAEETINLFTLAIARGVTREELRDLIWAYPTASGDGASMLD